jgi:hypothetical protein
MGAVTDVDLHAYLPTATYIHVVKSCAINVIYCDRESSCIWWQCCMGGVADLDRIIYASLLLPPFLFICRWIV